MLQAFIYCCNICFYCCKDLNKSLQHYSLPASHHGEHASARLFTARDLAPIRRLLTPKMLPHMAPSGMEFAPGRTVRILPRRSAEAAIGRQRGPPRIDPESSPRDGRSEPHDATAPGRRATPPIDAARLAGVCQRARA